MDLLYVRAVVELTFFFDFTWLAPVVLIYDSEDVKDLTNFLLGERDVG